MTLRTRIGAVLSLALVLLTGASVARSQVSPGPLAAPHAAIDGATQCFQCHAKAGAKTGMDARCLACHGEIGWMRTQKRGFHTTVAAKECASCHPDHGGRDFQLVAWDGGSPEKFDHRRAGFVLEGKHASAACRDCHKPALQRSGAVALMKRKDHSKSWLGLERACADCHTDVHRGQLGRECAKCHSQDAFKPVRAFDHARTAYPLTGAHATLACAKCHTPVAGTHDEHGQPLLQWKPLAHGDCASCHKDPHAGRFPGACAKCHEDTNDFAHVRSGGFNHDLTRYPLRGRHAAMLCAKCHDERTAFGPKPKFAQCADCHADAHHGLATLAGKPADCASCHDVSGFDRPTYSAVMHQNSAYPLVGAHATAACERCHAKREPGAAVVAALGTSRIEIRPRHGDCTDCHHDPHAGRFDVATSQRKARACTECHSPSSFHPSSFDAARHSLAGFALEGAHRAVPCQACHRELDATAARTTLHADSTAMRPLRFENRSRLCVDCHRDPHDGQFATRKDKGACEGCHDTEAFAPARRFDHARDTHFKLDGAHAHTPCASCHAPTPLAGGGTLVRYRPTPTRCEDCHAQTDPQHSHSTRLNRARAETLAALVSREADHVPHP